MYIYTAIYILAYVLRYLICVLEATLDKCLKCHEIKNVLCGIKYIVSYLNTHLRCIVSLHQKINFYNASVLSNTQVSHIFSLFYQSMGGWSLVGELQKLAISKFSIHLKEHFKLYRYQLLKKHKPRTLLLFDAVYNQAQYLTRSPVRPTGRRPTDETNGNSIIDIFCYLRFSQSHPV